MSSETYRVLRQRISKDNAIDEAWEDCLDRINGDKVAVGLEQSFKYLMATQLEHFDQSKWANIPEAERRVVVGEISRGVMAALEAENIWLLLWRSIPMRIRVAGVLALVGIPATSANVVELAGVVINALSSGA